MPKQYYKVESYHSRKSIGYLMRRGRNLITAQVQDIFRQKPGLDGVSFVHWVVLMCLRDDLANTLTEISQYVCYDAGALTRVIDQMEERGLLKRKRSGKDRRVVELKLTREGRKVVESLIFIVVDYYNDLLRDFTHEEVNILLQLLTRLVGKLDAVRDGS